MDIINSNISIKLTRTLLTLAPANKVPKYTLIFLHGVDMSIQKFFSVFMSSSIIKLLDDFKILVPQAPIRQIAMYGGREGFSWYTLSKESFNEASDNVKAMLDREIETLDNDPKRVFLGGFSQGSSLALDAGLSYDKALGGIIVVGGFMSEMSKIENIKENPDILIVHGKQDEIIKLEKAQETMKSVLERPNAKMVVLEDMAHDLYSEEAKKLVHDFIRERAKNE